MLFTITNKNGVEAVFSSLGARIVSLKVPDRAGNLIDVVQGFDTEEEYAEKGKSQGAICGRYANRIANAEFTIDGITYRLQKNNGDHCLHGGDIYLRLVDYKGESFGKQVHFMYQSTHLEGGFPGTVPIEITYTLTDENCLKIQMNATTDYPTHLNLTSHPYFNLNGEGSGSIYDHQLQVFSSSFLEIDQGGIPTGSLIDVDGTGFDFREEVKMQDQFEKDHDQITLVKGFDHCFVFDQYEEGHLKQMATVKSDQSGIQLIVQSTYPGIQLYTANEQHQVGKHGHVYGNHSAICLEPQFYPDSPNQPDFPSTLLLPKEKYEHTIQYQFLTYE